MAHQAPASSSPRLPRPAAALFFLGIAFGSTASAAGPDCARLLPIPEARASSPAAYEEIRVAPVAVRTGTPFELRDVVRTPTGQTFKTSIFPSPPGTPLSFGLETEIIHSDKTVAGSVHRTVDTDVDGRQILTFLSAAVDAGRVTTEEGNVFTLADYATLRQFKAAGVGPGTVKEASAHTVVNRRTMLELAIGVGDASLLDGRPASAEALASALNSLIRDTHTSRYVGRILGMTGNRISRATIELQRPGDISLKNLILEARFVTLDSPTQELLRKAKAKLCPDTDCDEIKVPSYFDITYAVRPAGA